MREQGPELDTLIVPVGGGGLISGMAIAAHGINPDIQMVGVESAAFPSAYAALQNDPSLVKGGQTIAEGIAVKNIGRMTLAVISEHVAELMRVEEAAIERAIGRSEEHTSELQSLMSTSYAVFCLKKIYTAVLKYIVYITTVCTLTQDT